MVVDNSVAVCFYLSFVAAVAAQHFPRPVNHTAPSVLDSGIEGNIHQYWPDENPPEQYKEWRESWTKLNPNANYILWTDKTNRLFVAKFYKWLLPSYDDLPNALFRANFVRFLYLHAFGGVYADIDMQALRPISDVLAEHKETAFLGALDPDPESENYVPTAWLAGRKAHPFWLSCAAETVRTMHRWDKKESISEVAGQKMLRRALQQYNATALKPEDQVAVLPGDAIFPVKWSGTAAPCNPEDLKAEKYSSANKCAAKYNSSYAIAYWVQNWFS